ncbi:hypothetical protein GR160_14430 [Flavobacterium sp. Sd200]|uniref:hypothetical protein n=1 Tax=Flavobacterium sp. Sd200 TaxID=2692211 RepID=UPI00136E24C8|nr:hypothetical protein [Flavobacterium sp. Sd200]MXN92422.1 hypothetical protein [Flavobacterium sp. Sd200]
MKKRQTGSEAPNSNKNVVLGNDKDENGCVTSAGYRWSVLKEECIRPVEECYRLNSIEQLESESDLKSAYVIFEEDGDRAELFLPNSTKSVMLKKESKNGAYKDAHWSLFAQNGYKLSKDGKTMFAGAEAVQQGQITGDYSEDGFTVDVPAEVIPISSDTVK